MDQSKSFLIVLFHCVLFFLFGDGFVMAQTFQKDKLVSDQQIENSLPLALWEERSDTGRSIVNKNQIGIDLGVLLPLPQFLSYVRRVNNTNLSIGGGVGFVWELNSHSFEGNIWEARHVVVFARYQFFQALQVDVGPTLLSYYYADDCSDCSGTFVGVHSAAMVGHRFLFFGPCVRVGWADDRKYGSAFGAIWNLQARVVIPWGK